jgi:hypothetical protein
VVFVVVALGAGGRLLGPASAGALLALLLVVALGLWLHRPLSKVPENALKFAVGVMLTAFGTYWAGEGIGLAWPGQDATILVLITAFLAVGLGLVKICARLHVRPPAHATTRATPAATAPSGLALIGGELLGLFVDDLWLAVGVTAWIVGAGLLEAQHPAKLGIACTLFTAGLAAVLSVSAVRRARA